MDKKTIIDFKFDLIRQINKYRNSHGVKSLRSDYENDRIAQNLADQLSQNGSQYDTQNLEETVYSSRYLLSPINLAKILYSENSNYNYNDENQTTSNFTKMVWKNSDLIGFGMQKDSYNNYIYVIKYHPIENNEGELQKNVFPYGTKYSETFKPNKNDPSKKKDNYITRNIPLTKYNDYSKYTKKEPSKKKTTGFDIDKFCLEALNAHNYYRRIHHARPLTINKQLSKIADSYSKRLAYTIRGLQHSSNRYNNEPLGENLYYCYGKEPTGNMTTKNWYDEIEDYDFNSDWGCSGCGHFTQVIWKGSKEVGFGVTKNNRGQYFVVANYFPAGNTIGTFKENVLRP